MSYASAAPLQAAIYAALTGDATVAALSGGAIYDALPPGPVPDLYVSLGPDRATARDDVTGAGAVHDLPVTITTTGAGFAEAKTLAGAISDALDGADLSLTRGQLTRIDFRRARARRAGEAREIQMWFRAHVDLA